MTRIVDEEVEHHCRICGLFFDEPPWGWDGKTPLFDMCPCCGVEFGYEDSTVEGALNYRAKWLDAGAPWFYRKLKPEGWLLDEQLAQIPAEFRMARADGRRA